MRYVKASVYGVLAMGWAGVEAGPVILEGTTQIQPPPGIQLCCEVAIDGDSAIVTGARAYPENPDVFDSLAFLFRRNASGVWTSERTLAELRQDLNSATVVSPRVAMKNGTAAVWLNGLNVWERSTSGWAQVAAQASVFNVQDVETDGNTILLGEGNCTWSAQPLRRASTATWQPFGHLSGGTGGCGGIFAEADVDVAGRRAIVFNNSTEDSRYVTEARIYEEYGGLPWIQTAVLTNPVAAARRFGPHVALHGDTALVTGDIFDSIYVFDQSASAMWEPSGRVELPERIPGPHKLALRDGFAFLSYASVDHQGGVVAVLHRQSNGQFKYVARLTATGLDGRSVLGGQFDVSGRRVIVAGDGSSSAYVFDLPATFTQPAPKEEDFQSNSASNWTQTSGSSFSVTTAGASRYFRQSSTLGDARALLTTVNLKNQAVEADVTPTAFPGAGPGFERWAGLIARYQDSNNYYYVTLRSSNVLQLKRMHDGVFSTLASVALPVTLNRTYRVRLETMGRSLKVYVDGVLAAIAADDAIAQGQVGLATYKAQANFDNVLVTANHFTRVFQTDFAPDSSAYWSLPLGTWESAQATFVQSSLAGDARALTGPTVTDQVIQVNARAMQFATGGERWFGAIARYKDPGNFYYVTLRNTNVISLRKLVNGTASVIATASLPVSVGTAYDLRFSAVGNQLRVWVNGKLLLQGVDTSHVSGRFGLATYKTTATYDNLLVYQP